MKRSMIDSNRRTVATVAAPPLGAILLALGFALAGCTPATPDTPPTGGTGGSGPGSSGGANGTGASNGSGGSDVSGTGGSVTPGSGGSGQSGGVTGSGGGNPTGSGGSSTGSGGSSVGSGGAVGTGGAQTGGRGGSVGTGGSVGSGGGGGGTAVRKGCWNTADGSYAMGATLSQDGRIVLFDGTSMAEWKRENTASTATDWFIDPNDKAMVVKHTPTGTPTDMQSRRTFEDLCIHVEYMTPVVTSADVDQNRGNSGVYLKSAYELQILDSVGFPVNAQSCGAIYLIRAPNVSACFRQLIWNSYEAEFKSSRWNGATRLPSPAGDAMFVAVTLNGILIHGGAAGAEVRLNPVNLMTEAGIPDQAGPQPLLLQDHRWPVKFKNIWVRVPQY